MKNHFKQRNRHLVDEVMRQYRQSDPGTSIRELVRRAVESPAPEYYISFNRAIRAVGRKIARPGVAVGGTSDAMWSELAGRTIAEMKRNKLCISHALARVLSRGNASSFFISPATGLSIYFRHFQK